MSCTRTEAAGPALGAGRERLLTAIVGLAPLLVNLAAMPVTMC